MALTSGLQDWYIRSLPGMNTKAEERELDDKYVSQAQNCRFEPEPGGIDKRKPVTKFNSSSLGTGPVLGLYRYYTSGGATLFVTVHDTTCYVGDDATGAFSSIKSSLTSGKRMAFTTYKDLLICSNGYDNPFVYDGDTTNNLTWELGSCKAVAGSGTGITRTSISYQITMDDDAYVCGAISNEIATVTNKNIELTNIPTGPVGTTNRKIYRKDSGTSGGYKLVTTIANNTATTYTDNTDDVSAGAAIPAVTDDFPKGNILQVHRERLFISGDPSNVNRIYYANPYLPWYIQQTTNLDYLDISPQDNDEIAGIPIHLGVMVVIKKNSLRKVHVTTPVSGADPISWYADDPITWIGSPAPWSIVQTPYGIVFLGWDHWYLFDGASPKPIIDEFDTTDILSGSYSDVVSYYHRGILLAAYTDATIGAQYHDRIMYFDMKREKLGYDLLDCNCFASKSGDDEIGELYYGNSQNGWVLMASNEELSHRLRTKTECNAGTAIDTWVGGTETAPRIEIGSNTAAQSIPADICMFWDQDTHPGSGWTEITADDDRFIYISASNVGTQVAGSSHTHTVTGTLTWGSSTTIDSHFGGTANANTPHEHTVSAASGSASPYPRYIQLRMFKKNGTTTEYEFPNGAIVMYSEPSAPTGWQNYGTDGYYIYIKSGSSTLGIAVPSTHEHTMAVTSGGPDSAAVPADNGLLCATYNHTHVCNGTLEAVNQNSWELSSVAFRFIKKIGETDTWDGTSLYVYTLFASSSAASNGWEEVITYEGRFLKIGVSQPALVSAANAAHTHVIYDGLSEEGTPLTGSGAVPDVQSQSNHTHPWDDFASSSESSTTPPYVKYRLFRKILGKMRDYNAAISANYTEGVWISPGIQLNAESLSQLFWNESIVSGDSCNFYTRTASTQALVEDATSCVADNVANKFTKTSHGLSNGDRITIGGTAVPTGIKNDLVYYVVGVSGADFQVSLTAGGSAVDFSTDGTSVTFKKWSANLTDPNGSFITSTADVWFQYMVAFTAVDTTVDIPYVYHTDGFVVKATYTKGATEFETAVEFIYDIGWRNFQLPFVDKIFKKIALVYEGTTGSFLVYWYTENSSGNFTVSLNTYPERWDSFFPSDAMGKEFRLRIYKNDNEDFTLKEIKGLFTPEPVIT